MSVTISDLSLEEQFEVLQRWVWNIKDAILRTQPLRWDEEAKKVVVRKVDQNIKPDPSDEHAMRAIQDRFDTMVKFYNRSNSITMEGGCEVEWMKAVVGVAVLDEFLVTERQDAVKCVA